jgi:hypothetical protein
MIDEVAWQAVTEHLIQSAGALDAVSSLPCTEEQNLAAERALAELDAAAQRFRRSLAPRLAAGGCRAGAVR